MLQRAFKEWAVICEALGRGQQALILRKGGIEENAGELGGSLSAATESAYATSLGAGLAVVRNAMQLQRDYNITTQNLFTILQLYQNRKQPLPVLEKVVPVGKKSRKGRP